MMGPGGQYGPWDPAYGYPPGQGTAGPQPPPDPQSAQTAQNVGSGTPPPPSPQQTTPQPPTVDPSQQQTPPFSLNDVAANLQDKPELDLGQRFNTYYNLIKQTLPDTERPHLDESTKPGLLANLLTFGGAGMWDHDYRQAYNAAVDKHNADLHGVAVKNALSMVADDVRGHSGDIGTQIRLLGLYQQMLNSKNTEFHRRILEDLRRRGIDISEEGLALRGSAPPPTEQQRAAGGDLGLVWEQDPNLPPGHGHWVRPGGRSLDPNTPVGQKLGGTGGTGSAEPPPAGNAEPPPAGNAPPTPPASSATTTPQPDPNRPLTSDELRAKIARQKGEEELQKNRQTTIEEVRRNADSVRNYLDDAAFDKAVNAVLPSGKGNPVIVGSKRAANVLGTNVKNWQGDPNAAYLQRAESNIIESIRALAAGSKGLRITIPEIDIFGKQWQQLARGQMTREEALEFKRQFKVRLDQVQKALDAQPQAPATTTTPSSTPTPSTQGNTRTLSSGRTIIIEP